MKYTYYYQTKENENRSGEIKARDRADAYTQLRKQGIRPYRVVGDDPAKWRRWLPVVGTILPFVAVAVVMLVADFRASGRKDDTPLVRQQLIGDEMYIAYETRTGWSDVLPAALDRYLAAYAQPGWEVSEAVPPESMLADLELSVAPAETDRSEVRQLKRILLQMRSELSELVANGGTLADYAEIIDDRQKSEVALRAKALDSLLSTPHSLRRRAFTSLNICLRDRNIAPLPESLLGGEDF